MIDHELQSELRRQYNPDGSPLRDAQLRMLELLKFLDRFCREHNLRYWLAYGTLLGAAMAASSPGTTISMSSCHAKMRCVLKS